MKRFINVMVMRASHFIKWPDNKDLDLVKRKFERIRCITQVCSAIDCSHVKMELSSKTRSMDNFNKDKDYNYDVQAILGTNYV